MRPAEILQVSLDRGKLPIETVGILNHRLGDMLLSNQHGVVGQNKGWHRGAAVDIRDLFIFQQREHIGHVPVVQEILESCHACLDEKRLMERIDGQLTVVAQHKTIVGRKWGIQGTLRERDLQLVAFKLGKGSTRSIRPCCRHFASFLGRALMVAVETGSKHDDERVENCRNRECAI